MMNLQNIAEQALAALKREGADAAQVSASRHSLTELGINHSQPSLLRSTHSHKLSLSGIWDEGKASTELSDFSPEALAAAAIALRVDALAAPQDPAHAVSSGQQAAIVRGPQQADLQVLTDAARELLEFRARETPTMNVEEGAALHTLAESQTLTSGASHLSSSLGWYGLNIFGTARGPGPDGQVRTSSFNFAGGETEDLQQAPASSHFGIATTMRDLTRSVLTQSSAECFGGKFVGDVVLSPAAVSTLMNWLLGQVSDLGLISGNSMYRERVEALVASPLLSLVSRFDAPGVAALSADAFATPAVRLLVAGRLQTLTPSLYGSRKTGLPHVPTVSNGWEVLPGRTPLSELLRDVPRGAIVGRLSMGHPAANGDFSGIIKNSFAIKDGAVGMALSETMINGNVAQMLRDASAVSAERVDCGGWCMPWVRVPGLHFS